MAKRSSSVIFCSVSNARWSGDGVCADTAQDKASEKSGIIQVRLIMRTFY
jgi:hypothetical protein